MSKPSKTIDPVALLRKQVEMSTQTEVARRAKVSAAYICQVLSGRRPCAGKLAKYLGLKVHARMAYTYEPVDKQR